MELHLKLIGLILIGLAFVHAIFPKYFNWRNDFDSVRLINKEMMYVHTFFIALVLFLTGILCLTSSKLILESELGKRLALGLYIFWFVRLLVQFFGYSSKLWQGKKLETFIHILFSILWSYFSLVFFMIFFS